LHQSSIHIIEKKPYGEFKHMSAMKQAIAARHYSSPDAIIPFVHGSFHPQPVVRRPAPRVLPDRIYIIGFSGVGKTTEGAIIADMLGRKFIDLDQAIVRSTGKTISQIFAEEGQDRFRAIETHVLSALAAAESNAVIACGGGTVCERVNRRILKESGLSILLVADVPTIYERTRSSDRPLLGGADPQRKIKELLRDRRPLYLECADRIFSTGRALPDAVGRDICNYYLATQRQAGML
jgi:shikimate kinase